MVRGDDDSGGGPAEPPLAPGQAPRGHPAIYGTGAGLESPRTAYERLAARFRARNEEWHIVVPGGFTGGQLAALDRAWEEELRRQEREGKRP